MPLAVVTGGGSGIGRALALALARSEHRVLIAGRRAEALAATVSAAGEAGVRITPVCVDISTAEGVAAIASECAASGEPVDILVHNAGTLGPVCSVADVDMDAWHATFAVNVDAPLALTRALLPAMRSPGGRILNVGSGAAHRYISGWPAYCASKSALHMLFLAMREDLQARGTSGVPVVVAAL